MTLLTGLLFILAGLALLAFGGIGLLFTFGPGGDAGAVAFTGACALAGLALIAIGMIRLIRR